MKAAMAVLWAVGCVAAQEPHFGTRARLVQVPVAVATLQGSPVSGLEAEDFQVFDDGRPQRITVDTIDTGVAPIALVVAVQSSGISAPAIEKVRRIGAMIQPMVTGERGCAGVISFGDRVQWLTKCTKDADALGHAFGLLHSGFGKTGRMLDAVEAAVVHLRGMANVRRILLLISEARDRGSESTLGATVAAAQSAGVTVYAAPYSAFREAFTSKAPVAGPKKSPKPQTPDDIQRDTMGTANGAPPSKYNPKIGTAEQRVDILSSLGELAQASRVNAVEALTRETGGSAFPFTREKALEAAVRGLGDELHNQYVLSFAPEPGRAGYHRIEVRVVRRGEYRIRARPGYWSGTDVR
jgi:VWFA-related protein